MEPSGFLISSGIKSGLVAFALDVEMYFTWSVSLCRGTSHDHPRTGEGKE